MRPGWAAVVFVALLGAACAPIVRRVTLNGAGEAFMTLGLRERVSVDGERLEVRFDGVNSDSRCPADVACIQAGSATVGITVTAADGSRRTYQLDTEHAQPVVHAGVTIALEGLDPRPVSSGPTRPEDYRLTLRVRR